MNQTFLVLSMPGQLSFGWGAGVCVQVHACVRVVPLKVIFRKILDLKHSTNKFIAFNSHFHFIVRLTAAAATTATGATIVWQTSISTTRASITT